MTTTDARALIGFLVCWALTVASISEGRAAEWSAEPSVAIRGEYNSNLILTAQPHDGVWGHWVSPGLKFGGSTECLDVSGKAAADFIRYYGGREQGFTNLYFPLTVRYKTDRETFTLDGGLTRDNTLMGELSHTGVVLNFTQRNLWNLAPSWTHALTERWSLQAGYQFADATYENGLRLGLVNYATHGGSGGVSYRLTEKDDIQVTGTYINFQAPQASGLRSGIYGGQVSMTHAFTDALTLNVAGGPRWVNSAIGVAPNRVRDRQTVGVFNGTLRQTWDDSFFQVEVSREIYPSGFGVLLQTDRAGITYSRALTEQFTGSVNASVLLASAVASRASAVTLHENRYANVTPRMTWKISDWWAVDLVYSYARRDVDSSHERAFAHSGSVMLTYFPPKLSVGR